MYMGRAVDTVVHEHHAIQIAISLEDEIEIISSNTTIKQKAVIIASDEPHECRTQDNTFLLFNIDPECKIGAGLKKAFLSETRIATLPEATVEGLLENIKSGEATIFDNTLKFLKELSNTPGGEVMDDRIVKVLEFLRQPGDGPITIKRLSATVYLSPSRLIHLFTSQVGIPIRKYILWSRLLTAVQHLHDARDMTDAALEAGFSDAPHFNRTFKRMFGLAPSLIMKNSQIIQAYVR